MKNKSTINKVSASIKNIWKTDYDNMYQKLYTTERNEKISISIMGELNPNYGNVDSWKYANENKKCDHCDVVANLGNIALWHDDNCKFSPTYNESVRKRPQEKTICPHCGNESGNINKVYHFDNCKYHPDKINDTIKNEKTYNSRYIDIFNNHGELVFHKVKNFMNICKENNLPTSALKKSYQNNGSVITIKNTHIKYRSFIGWYAKMTNISLTRSEKDIESGKYKLLQENITKYLNNDNSPENLF